MSHRMVEKLCEQCGSLFTTRQEHVNAGKGRFCSRKCAGIARTTKVSCHCLYCGMEFFVSPSNIKNGVGKYCSKKCQYLDHKPIEYTCLYCGAKFTDVPGAKKRKYCSVRCYKLSKPLKVTEKVCEVCGVTFTKLDSDLRKNDKWGKYCSRDCRGIAERNRIKRNCIICRKEFDITPAKLGKAESNGIYCSTRCQGIGQIGSNNRRWRGGGKSSRGANWKQQRKLAYERDGGICQVCGRKPKFGERKFDVHHVKPFRYCIDYLEANRVENLLVLCRKCHAQAEVGKITLQPKLL